MKFFRIFLIAALIALAFPQATLAIGMYESTQPAGSYASCRTGTNSCYCDAQKIDSLSGSSYTSSDQCSSYCTTQRAGKWSVTCSTDGISTSTVAGETINYESNGSQIQEGSGKEMIKPDLIVDIPGVDFEDSIGYDDDGNIKSNFFGEYVDGVYRFLIPAMALVAVVMLMVSGLQYVLARGEAGVIKKAKERMANAVVGLVLLLAAYNIAFIIDPNTVFFDGLSITKVDGAPTPEEPADELGTTPIANEEVTSGLTTVSGDHLIPPPSNSGQYISESVLTALNEAADTFYESSKDINKGKSVNIRVTSASRTVSKQAALFYSNCLSNLSSSGIGACSTGTCDPTGSSLGKSSVIKYLGSSRYQLIGDLANQTDESTIKAALVSHGNTSYCPHTTNIAIDVWPEGSTKGNTNVALMDLMTKTLQNKGFCRIDIEAWHFQLDSLSGSSCKGYTNSQYTWRGKTYQTTGCKYWDFSSNVCKVKNE